MSIRLRPFTARDELAALEAHRELLSDSFSFLLDWDLRDDWSEYLQRLSFRRRGIELPPDRVPAALLGAFAGDELVGRVSIRFALNDFLRHEGGNIGYAIRPAHRRRGYATECLRQALVISRSEGVDRVLVVCEDGNLGSQTVIESCGGVLEDVRVGSHGSGLRRYWID